MASEILAERCPNDERIPIYQRKKQHHQSNNHLQLIGRKDHIKYFLRINKVFNRVATGFSPTAPTPPIMRVRNGRFTNRNE
ncbi:MAG: hypothetical protein KZQ70_12410, partial [gamma proteobacterium symbiont of Lucinoma myriamae]|nr:hypothetical protein [gamma proteobacterium symbiont of Lucinoma myriamae]